MENYIAIIILVVVVVAVVTYIIIQKKKGKKCIGCPNGGLCEKCCKKHKDENDENNRDCIEGKKNGEENICKVPLSDKTK